LILIFNHIYTLEFTLTQGFSPFDLFSPPMVTLSISFKISREEKYRHTNLLFLSALIVGSLVSKTVGMAVYDALQASAPGWAESAAITSSLMAALTAGVGVGWLVRSMWGKFERIITRKKSKPSLA
jgi:hypothetical protein